METLVTHEIERKKDGSRIVRNFFFNSDKTNYLVKAQSYFTKDEKKQAKLSWKQNQKSLILFYLLYNLEHFLDLLQTVFLILLS